MAGTDGLRRLGFTENEAKVYVALVQHPASTGYEVSRHSGVPRAKVYEVLEGLLERGAVLPEQAEDRTLYRALPFATLLQEHRRSTDQLLSDLYRDLSQLSPDRDRPAAVSVTGQGRVITRAAALIEGARESILASGRPEELQTLGPKLAEAQRRGVQVQVLSRGPARVPVSGLTILPGTGGRPEWAALALVVDGQSACLADFDLPEPFAAFLTAPGIAQQIGGWIRREIGLAEQQRPWRT